MTTETEHLQRAAHAQDALNNPLIGEALDQWEKDITETWKTSPLADVDGREKLRLMLEAAKQFRSHLLRTMETGQLIRAQAQKAPTMWDRVSANLQRRAA